MRLRVTSDDGSFTSVQAEGPLVALSSGTCQTEFEAVLGADACSRRVALSLDGIKEIDSSGVSWLLSASDCFRRSGGFLVLHSLSEAAAGVVGFLRIQPMLTIASNAPAALAILSQETVAG